MLLVKKKLYHPNSIMRMILVLLMGDFSSTVTVHGLPSSLAFRAVFRYADSRRFNP
jgi:hypothetical protein